MKVPKQRYPRLRKSKTVRQSSWDVFADMSNSGDPNMSTALSWAEELGSIPDLPSSLDKVQTRAELVKAINVPLIIDLQGRASLLFQISPEDKERRFDELGKISLKYIPDISDETTRINITLRLWSGCLSAAKTIAMETLSDKNTSGIRQQIFTSMIDPTARSNEIYRAGVESAPALKRSLNEPISFDGVPENSSVRRFA